MRFGAVLKNKKSHGAVWCCSNAVIYPTVRFGAVFRSQESYGAARCGLQIDIVNPTVRFGTYRDTSYGAVWRGSPLNVFFFGAAPLSVGKTVQHRFFSTVHRMVLALFLGAPTKPLFFYCLFLYGAPYVLHVHF